jgi:hypothetical protein
VIDAVRDQLRRLGDGGDVAHRPPPAREAGLVEQRVLDVLRLGVLDVPAAGRLTFIPSGEPGMVMVSSAVDMASPPYTG